VSKFWKRGLLPSSSRHPGGKAGDFFVGHLLTVCWTAQRGISEEPIPDTFI